MLAATKIDIKAEAAKGLKAGTDVAEQAVGYLRETVAGVQTRIASAPAKVQTLLDQNVPVLSDTYAGLARRGEGLLGLLRGGAPVKPAAPVVTPPSPAQAPVETPQPAAKKAPAKAAAKKAAPKKAAPKKTAAQKTAAQKTAAQKTAAQKTAAQKTAAQKTAATKPTD